jgi:hypothetical protein
MRQIGSVAIVFFVICFFSCRKGLHDEIVNYIKNNCTINNQNDRCIIDIREISDIDWDTMYIFPSWSMPENISSSLGLKYDRDYVKDDTKRMIFIKNDEIVREEDYYVWSKNRIVFSYTDWPNQIIKYSTSRFSIKKIQEGGDSFYKLEPIY